MKDSFNVQAIVACLVFLGMATPDICLAGNGQPEAETRQKLDRDEGLESLRQKAEQGDANAQRELGLKYLSARGSLSGRGIQYDYAKAKEWFEKAAAQGHAKAQANLGDMYYSGRGVPQDYAKAKEWYEKAAAQGYDNAQLGLANIYYYGKGVPQDYAKAKAWVEKAAAQGSGMARLILTEMENQGH